MASEPSSDADVGNRTSAVSSAVMRLTKVLPSGPAGDRRLLI